MMFFLRKVLSASKSRYRILIFLMILVVVIGACQKINIDYVGQTFPKTPYAKIFLSMKEVKRPYNVIGKALVRASTSFSSLEIQNKLRKTAEDKGADGVIILSYKEVPAGMYAYNNFPMYGMYDGMYGWGGMGCMCPNNFGPYYGDMYYGGYGMGEESVQCYYDYIMRVNFIRYKVQPNDIQEVTLNGKPIKFIVPENKNIHGNQNMK